MRTFLVLFLFCHTVSASAWEKILEDPDFTLYKKQTPGNPLVSLKGTMLLKYPLPRVFNTILDTARYKEWQPNLKEFSVLEKKNRLEFINYTAFQAPWPVKNRDSVNHVRIILDLKSHWIHFHMESGRHASAPRKPDFIRIPASRFKWSIHPVAGGAHTWVEFSGYADPGGEIPKWLVNWLGRYQLRTNLKRFQEQLARGRFDHNLLKEYPEIEKFYGK